MYMRGNTIKQTDLLTLINLESRIPVKHPIRRIKAMMDDVLESMDDYFEPMYESHGRASIPPERLLKAKVLMALYTVRSDRQFCERLNYDLLFQWFLDMNPSEAAFHATSFTKNMSRLLKHRTSELFFSEVVELARRHNWVSNEHFSVDGTLIESWASMKSFRAKDEPEDKDSGHWQDFKGKKRGNDTHESRTDPQARLLRKGKGKEARLCFAAHAAMENRNGLCVLMDLTASVGVSEPEQALRQMEELRRRGFDPHSVGADSAYHTKAFVRECRERGIAPHAAPHSDRKTPGLDGRHRRSSAYQTSQKLRKRIENIFGWAKTTGAFRKSRYRGIERTGLCAHFVAAACNLVRMARLQDESPPVPAGA